MKLRTAALRAFALPLASPLATAHGTITRREGWLVRLGDDAGRLGFGEVSPLPAFGGEDAGAARDALRTGLRAWVEAAPDFEAALEISERVAAGTPCARSGAEAALADLAAQAEGLSLAAWLQQRIDGNDAVARPEHLAVQALVGGASPADIAASTRRAVDEDYAAIKLKLAAGPQPGGLERDLERVAACCEAAGPGIRIRLDANEAFSRNQAARVLAALARFPIDFVEQPVARADLDGLASLATRAPVAVAADEALLGSGLDACMKRRVAGIWIFKPALAGGLARSFAVIRHARCEGIRLVVSSLIDGAVGRGFGAALAAASGATDEIHGLGTGRLLAMDLAPGQSLRPGRIRVSEGPGLGLGASVLDSAAGSIWQSPWESIGAGP